MAHPNFNLPPPFDDLMRRHEHAIMRLCLRLAHDREEALDLFQDVWLRAYRAYPRVSGDHNLRAWLFTIATNTDRNRRRDRMRRDRALVSADPAALDGHEARSACNLGPLAVHLKQALAQLPERQRRAFVMRKLGGLEYDEIGAALGCSGAAARVQVFSALKKIKAGWPS